MSKKDQQAQQPEEPANKKQRPATPPTFVGDPNCNNATRLIPTAQPNEFVLEGARGTKASPGIFILTEKYEVLIVQDPVFHGLRVECYRRDKCEKIPFDGAYGVPPQEEMEG